VPRAWLADGQSIELRNVATYFGRLSLRVESRLGRDGTVRATFQRRGGPAPKAVELRLPHPEGRRAVSVEGGRYDAGREVVRIPGSRGAATVTARF
jgi:hypothetical protein